MLHVVIPVYNEKDNIGRTLADIERHVRAPHDVTIVYDFEEDDTLPAARAYAAETPTLELRFLRNDLGRGVVNALRKGLKAHAEGHVLVTMADGSDDLGNVDAMVALMEQGCDLVCGSRYMRGGRQVGGPLLKRVLSRLAGLSLHWLTGIPTHDVTNSFKMYSTSLLRAIDIESSGGFEVGLEILVKCFVRGGRIAEVPTTWQDRTAGESRFQTMKWIPHYLKWYLLALRYRWLGA